MTAVNEANQQKTQLSKVESSFSQQTAALQAVANASAQFSARLAAKSEDRVAIVASQLSQASRHLVGQLVDCAAAETNVVANIAAIESLLAEFKLADERIDGLRIVSEQKELNNLRDAYETRLTEQKDELEEVFEERICVS